MNTKNITLISVSILALVLLMNLASATLVADAIVVNGGSNTIANNAGSFTVTYNLTNNEETTVSLINSLSGQVGSYNITYSDDEIASAIDSETPTTETITATVYFPAKQSGSLSGTIHVNSEADIHFSVNILDAPSMSVSVSDLNTVDGITTATVTVTNEGNVPLSGVNLTSSGYYPITFSDSSYFNIPVSGSVTRSLKITEELEPVSKTMTVTATSGTTVASTTFSPRGSFCSYDDTNDLEISDISFDLQSGFGDDEEWFPFDEVEVSFNLENKNNDYDIKKIDIEWSLYDKDGNEIMNDDITSNDYDDKMNDGDDQDISFTITLDDNIEDLEDDSYTFIIKASGEVDDDDGSYDTCTSESESVDVIIEDDFVIIGDIKMPDSVSCGEEFTFSANVWNIGADDQDDIVVNVYSTELGFDEMIDIGNINALDSEKLSLTIIVPQNAEEKTYHIKVDVLDEDGDVYQNEYDNDDSSFDLPLKVEGSCSTSSSSTSSDSVAVSATLVTKEPTAGNPLEIEVTITNLGTTMQTFDLRGLSYQAWASSVDLSESTLVIGAGESKTLTMTFDVKDDSSGEGSFDIEVASNGNILRTQPVSVTIASKTGFNWANITGNIIGDNGLVWGIGIANLVLILVIIFVAIRITKK